MVKKAIENNPFKNVDVEVKEVEDENPKSSIQ